MTTKTKTDTETVIYGMLTENTGSHMLDSGGAYGRHWERNQKKTLEEFLAEPVQTFTGGEWPEVSKSLFWHLVNFLNHEPELTAEYHEFAKDYIDEPWLAIDELWLDKLGVPAEGEFYSDARWQFNSYNFENWLVDQTIQGTFFGMNGTEYLILQVHGGCDVRGGYTRPQVFSLSTWYGKDSFIFDAERADLMCSGSECSNRLDISGYEVELCDEDGNPIEHFQTLEDVKTCPCGGSWK